MASSDIIKEYQQLQKKHKLPDFEALDHDFEVSEIEGTVFLLRKIRDKMTEKLDFYANLLGMILQPDTNLAPLIECRAFSDDEKKDLFEVYRKLMYLCRSATETTIAESPTEVSAWLLNSASVWESIKKDLMKAVHKIAQSWKENLDMKTRLEYLG